MILTKREILNILVLIGEKTVVEPTPAFPYRVTAKGSGYHSDSEIAKLQAKLSIMLEMAK